MALPQRDSLMGNSPGCPTSPVVLESLVALVQGAYRQHSYLLPACCVCHGAACRVCHGATCRVCHGAACCVCHGAVCRVCHGAACRVCHGAVCCVCHGAVCCVCHGAACCVCHGAACCLFCCCHHGPPRPPALWLSCWHRVLRLLPFQVLPTPGCIQPRMGDTWSSALQPFLSVHLRGCPYQLLLKCRSCASSV